MYCTNCGKKMDDSALFCDRCGTLLHTSNKRVDSRTKRSKRLYLVCVVACVLACFGLYYFGEIRANNEIENSCNEAEGEMATEINEDAVKSTEVAISTEIVEENLNEEVELTKAEECLKSFIDSIVTSDFISMWNLIPEEEIRFWESVGYNKKDIENYFKYYTQITGLAQDELVNVQYDTFVRCSSEGMLINDIFAVANDDEIEYLERIDSIYYFEGIKLLNDRIEQNGVLLVMPEDDIKIGCLDGKYYVINYFLENAEHFVVDDIPHMLDMCGYTIESPSLVEQDVNSNYGTYVGVLTKRHYEADPNLGGYDYDYYYLDFGQTVKLTCDYYVDETLGILETEGISLSAEGIPFEMYLDEQVTIAGSVIDSGVRGGQMIIVDSIQ